MKTYSIDMLQDLLISKQPIEMPNHPNAPNKKNE